MAAGARISASGRPSTPGSGSCGCISKRRLKEAADLKKEAAGLRKRDESGDQERAIGKAAKAAEPPGRSGAAVKAVAADAG